MLNVDCKLLLWELFVVMGLFVVVRVVCCHGSHLASGATFNFFKHKYDHIVCAQPESI